MSAEGSSLVPSSRSASILRKPLNLLVATAVVSTCWKHKSESWPRLQPPSRPGPVSRGVQWAPPPRTDTDPRHSLKDSIPLCPLNHRSSVAAYRLQKKKKKKRSIFSILPRKKAPWEYGAVLALPFEEKKSLFEVTASDHEGTFAHLSPNAPIISKPANRVKSGRTGKPGNTRRPGYRWSLLTWDRTCAEAIVPEPHELFSHLFTQHSPGLLLPA